MSGTGINTMRLNEEAIHIENNFQIGLKAGASNQIHLRALVLPEPGIVTGTPGSVTIILPRDSARWLRDGLTRWLEEMG